MADYLNGLQPRKVPEASQLTSVQDYLRRYNEKYAELARTLVETAKTLKVVSEATGVRTDNFDILAALGIVFTADQKVTDTTKFVVNPTVRFYPDKLEGMNHFNPYTLPLSPTQTASLARDLEYIVGSPMKAIAITSDERPQVNVVHTIRVSDYQPLEKLILTLQKDKKIYNIIMGESLSINPDDANSEDSETYKRNRILASFDRTESGPYIPLGFNRLALLLAAQHFLAGEIDRKQEQATEIMKRLEELGRPEV